MGRKGKRREVRSRTGRGHRILSENMFRGIRALLRRPVFLMALFLIILILAGYAAGYFDRTGSTYSIADDRRMLVSGIVAERECTANGYRIILDHAQFLSGGDGASSVYRFVAETMNRVVAPDDRIQVFLSNGQSGNLTMYGEGEEASFWSNSSASRDQTKTFEKIRINDRVCFFGKCSQPEEATNPGQFDSRRYYLARGIILKMSEVKLRDLKHPSDAGFFMLYRIYRNALADMRIGIQTGLLSVFGQEDAAQIAAFTIGDKSGMSSALKQLYRDGGLTWLLCVSSLHISMLGMMIYRLLRSRGVPFLIAGSASFVLVNSYAMLSGFSISAQRALITFTIWLGSQIFGRTRDTLTSLSLAALFILIRQPYALWDSSFLLSYACILSMEYLTPAVERILKPRYALSKRICGSVSIRLGALPAVLWYFYQTTPFAFAAILIVLPLMSLLMGFAILGSLSGYALVTTGSVVFLYMGRCFAFPCHLLIQLMNLICRLEQVLPGSVLILGRPAFWQVLIYYAGLIALVIRVRTLDASSFQKRTNAGRHHTAEHMPGPLSTRSDVLIHKGIIRTRMICFLSVVMILVILCIRIRPEFQFLCLDVGQGSCNLIRHGGTTCLFDAGSSSVQDVWQYRIGNTLKYYGISEIDTVFLSHGDMDHINGIEQMLEMYRRNLAGRNSGDVTIRRILLPDLPRLDDRLAPILDGAGENGIVLESVRSGDCLRHKDLTFYILDPSPDRITGNSNEDCIVMMLAYKNIEILCMADLEKEGEKMLLKDWTMDRKDGFRILIAGHHGSKNATSEEFLRRIKPDLCFISCGKNNRYGHPAGEMLDRLSHAKVPYMRTDRDGAIDAAR